MENLCKFLDIEIIPEYIEDCSKAIFKEPKVTRNLIKWSSEDIKKIEDLCRSIDFLQGYSF